MSGCPRANLHQCLADLSDQKYTSLPHAFRILAFLVGELHHGENAQQQIPPPPQERQYARAYREHNVELRQKLAFAAKSFLEQECVTIF